MCQHRFKRFEFDLLHPRDHGVAIAGYQHHIAVALKNRIRKR